MRKNIKIILKSKLYKKEYEEEKKEMVDKINKLQKKLDYYMVNAVKNKEMILQGPESQGWEGE